MRKNELNNEVLQLYNTYVEIHAYALKREYNYERTKGLYEGFISGLYFANRIDTRIFGLMRKYNRCVVKSIIRHYRKVNYYGKNNNILKNKRR